MGQTHEVHEMIEFQLPIGFTAGIPYPTALSSGIDCYTGMLDHCCCLHIQIKKSKL